MAAVAHRLIMQDPATPAAGVLQEILDTVPVDGRRPASKDVPGSGRAAPVAPPPEPEHAASGAATCTGRHRTRHDTSGVHGRGTPGRGALPAAARFAAVSPPASVARLNVHPAHVRDTGFAARRTSASLVRVGVAGAGSPSAPGYGVHLSAGRAATVSARAPSPGEYARPAPASGSHLAVGRTRSGSSARAYATGTSTHSTSSTPAPPPGNPRLSFGRVGPAGTAGTNAGHDRGPRSPVGLRLWPHRGARVRARAAPWTTFCATPRGGCCTTTRSPCSVRPWPRRRSTCSAARLRPGRRTSSCCRSPGS